MAYIGIDPNVGDITFQKFTGDGSTTAFTLAQNVASGEAILVTVGNVIQEPGVTASYIAQGTTLTFSEAPANGDDIVVRFLGRAIDQPLSFAMQLFKYVATSNQTAFTGADSTGAVLAFGSDVDVYLNGVHLDTTDFTLSGGNTVTLASGATANDELVIRAFRAFAATDTVSKASGGAFTGAVTATGGLNVGTIKEATGTTTAMTIDTSGRVTTPVVPAWRVSLSANQSVSSTGYTQVQLDVTNTENCFLNGGVTISSYEVVAPITGIYAVNSYVRVDSLGTGFVQLGILVNGVRSGVSDTYVIDGSPPSNYVTLSASDVFSVTANDTFRLEVFTSNDNSYTIQGNTVFSGHLVG